MTPSPHLQPQPGWSNMGRLVFLRCGNNAAFMSPADLANGKAGDSYGLGEPQGRASRGRISSKALSYMIARSALSILCLLYLFIPFKTPYLPSWLGTTGHITRSIHSTLYPMAAPLSELPALNSSTIPNITRKYTFNCAVVMSLADASG